MKKIGKILLGIILVPYIAMVVFLTVCLLNYNQFNITELGSKTLIIIRDDTLVDFKKDDLVVVNENKNNEVRVGDYIFFYSTEDKDNLVRYGQVKDVTVVTSTESTFDMGNGLLLSSEYMIGKASTSDVYPSLGGILGFLESRWGFLFFVIFPVLIIFIYEIYMLITEIKGKDDDEEE